jgi:bifunctional non-homologous end joining protein LigD
MLLLRTENLPQGVSWAYELKLDGFRAEVIKTAGRVHPRSCNDKDFNGRYPAVVQGLAAMPDETIVDGEIVTLDEHGVPSFQMLQNFCAAAPSLHYYILDLLMIEGRDMMSESLVKRRAVP